MTLTLDLAARGKSVSSGVLIDPSSIESRAQERPRDLGDLERDFFEQSFEEVA
jgi:hypothetical protein